MEIKLKNNTYFLFFTQYFKLRLRIFAFLMVIIIIGVAAGSLNPFIYGKILDAVTAGDLEQIKAFILIYFSINLSATLLSLRESYLGQIVSYFITADIRKRLFSKIVRMRFKRLDAYPPGELMSRLDSDAETVVGFYINECNFFRVQPGYVVFFR
jgi:ATP-binding cassette subfamily B protein